MAWGMRLTSPSPESLLLSSRAGDSTAHRVWVLGTSRRRVRILCDSDRRCICRICSVCVIFSTSQKITKKKTCKFWPLLWYWSTVIWILENTWGRLLSRVYHQVVLWPSLWYKAIETPPPRAFPVATSQWMSWGCFSFPLLWQLVQQVSQNRGTKKKWNGLEHPSITSGGPFGRNPNRTTRVGRFILWLQVNSPSIQRAKRVMYLRKRLQDTATWFFLIPVKHQKQDCLKFLDYPSRLKKNMHHYRWIRTSPVSKLKFKIKRSRNFFNKPCVIDIAMIADCF